MKDYNEYLNIISKDKEDLIKGIVKNEMNEFISNNYSYEGTCKYIANNIKSELESNSIKSYSIDLNEFGIDHVSLIAEYYYNGIKRILIDPSIVQFKIKIETYMINKDLLLDLEEKGYTLLDQDKFRNYISMFAGKMIDIDLENYIEEIKRTSKNR